MYQFKKRVFAMNSNIVTSISLQLNVELRNFKLWTLKYQSFTPSGCKDIWNGDLKIQENMAQV